MPGIPRVSRLLPGPARRRVRTRLRPVLSPRGSLQLATADGTLQFAVHAAVGMALSVLPLVLLGRPELAVYPAMGSFTATFERGLPHRRRLAVLGLVALAMTAAVGSGSALAAATGQQLSASDAALVVAATAVVAGAAKFVCDVTGLRGLGAVLTLFGFAVAADSSATSGDAAVHTGLAAFGAGMAWLLAAAGWLLRPDRLQRIAIAEALRAVATMLEAEEPADVLRERRRATPAVLRAHRSLGIEPASVVHDNDRTNTLVCLTCTTWTLLVASAQRPPAGPTAAPLLRQQARMLTDRRRRLPPPPRGLTQRACTQCPVNATAEPAELAEKGAPVTDHAALPRLEDEAVHRRWARSARHRVAALVAPALRTTAGTGLAGGLSLLLGIGHGYWAAISAAAVLHSINVYSTVHRAVQRTVGTAVGLLLAGVVLLARPDPVVIVLVVLVLDFLLEYVVARNYGLGVVFLTPLALLLSELQSPAAPGTLLQDRVVGSALGIVAALLCALLVVHDRAAARVRHELAVCRAVVERAEQSLGAPFGERRALQGQLAAALVELREADETAAGELWSAGIDPADLAAVEERAYELLGRLTPS